jgi:Mg-chelatase subunit ChlD
MYLSFIAPAALLLLLILIPLWALSLLVPRRLPATRFWTSLGLRTAIIAALVLALAGTQVVRAVDRVTTVFLIDSSDSISPSMRGQAEAFVQDALKAMPPDDQAAVVVFGENALVERVPGTERTLGRITSIPVVSRTNIEQAVQLGLALLPADTKKRLVLLSDGAQNDGDARAAARIAAARGVQLSYVDLSAPSGGEALLDSLDAPASVRKGQEFELIATASSNVAQRARLQIVGQAGGQDRVLLEQDVQLQPGPNRFSVRLTADNQGFQRFRAQLTPQIDSRAQNNQAETLVRVEGPARVLLVEGKPGEAANLKRALDAAEVQATIAPPESMPADLAGLGDYEAVVLVNVPAAALPVGVMAALPAYVHDLGKGLVMIGGDRSFGVGGYGKTPVEQALPVWMDVRDREERPDLALIFVIDKSGSMDACHCSGPNRQTSQFRRGGTPKIDIAKDAVTQAAAMLRPNDTVGIVAFDGGAHWIFQPQRGARSEAIQSALAPVPPEGSTNVRAGLQAAEDALKQIDARIKHVILLTDGWSSGGDNVDIAQRMRDAGITLSVVAAGSGSADYLQRLASAGGGRYYPADQMENVPQIFVQETITVVGNYIIEEPYTPAYAAPSPVLDGLGSGLPQLYGYNGTTAKETATTALVGPDDAPILATWQYGLGRSAAWTSDATGKWAVDWVRWPGFPRFAAQLVSWTLPTASGGLAADVRAEGSQTVIAVQARSLDGKPRDGLEMQATIVGPGGSPQQVRLAQVAPGEYRASLPSPPQGTYLVQLVGQQDGRVALQDTVAMVVPYSPEYREAQSNPALLAQLARDTGGAKLTDPAAAFDHALPSVSRAQEIAFPLLLLVLLLLPLDIAVRRLSLRRSDFGALAAALPGRGRAPAGRPARSPDEERLARMREARERARRRARGEE